MDKPKKAWAWAKARRTERLTLRLSKREMAQVIAAALRTGEPTSEIGRRAFVAAGIISGLEESSDANKS